ncbi:perlucin-like [Ylistrum balloti]|uniref:perlucin-like n=1 Tax=Ylistrum balloti TaxID=509963 RepID=UPI002905D111|nr:perlucin-like [Ylistrum balloti]
MLRLRVFLVLIFASEWYCTKANSRCKAGWVLHDHSCYIFVNTSDSWIEHMQHCVLIGGHLASIDSEEENRFLEGGVRVRHASFWVGGTNMNANSSWVWIENNNPVPMRPCGHAHNYCKWNKDQPNNSHGNEHCLELNLHTHWNDNYCPFPQGAICEAKPLQEYHWITIG